MPDIDRHKLSHGHPDAELVSALEPDQIVAAASRPLPRYVLGRTANLALWTLRAFVLVITAMIVYTFVLSLI
jgi:hypothetical protein